MPEEKEQKTEIHSISDTDQGFIVAFQKGGKAYSVVFAVRPPAEKDQNVYAQKCVDVYLAGGFDSKVPISEQEI